MHSGKYYKIFYIIIISVLLIFAISITSAALEIDKNLQIDQEKMNTLQPVYVKRVIDGDTFRTSQNKRVRLLGVDTPELNNKGEIDLDYGDEAREYTRKHLEGKNVYLEYDVRQKDKFGRILAYVFLDNGTFFNAKLLATGYAHLLTIAPDVKYVDLFKKIAREAKKHERGLWGKYADESEELPVINWSQAGDYVGQKMVVTGTVVDTYDSRNAVFLNFDMEYWHTFTAVIFTEDINKFAVKPEKFYLNKKVKVVGNIQLYEESPEIIVQNPVQITIFE